LSLFHPDTANTDSVNKRGKRGRYIRREIGGGKEMFGDFLGQNIQHSQRQNIQHPTPNIEHPMKGIRCGSCLQRRRAESASLQGSADEDGVAHRFSPDGAGEDGVGIHGHHEQMGLLQNADAFSKEMVGGHGSDVVSV
jgi:hypothetical protein